MSWLDGDPTLAWQITTALQAACSLGLHVATVVQAHRGRGTAGFKTNLRKLNVVASLALLSYGMDAQALYVNTWVSRLIEKRILEAILVTLILLMMTKIVKANYISSHVAQTWDFDRMAAIGITLIWPVNIINVCIMGLKDQCIYGIIIDVQNLCIISFFLIPCLWMLKSLQITLEAHQKSEALTPDTFGGNRQASKKSSVLIDTLKSTFRVWIAWVPVAGAMVSYNIYLNVELGRFICHITLCLQKCVKIVVELTKFTHTTFAQAKHPSPA
jgi:hypothetical protein